MTEQNQQEKLPLHVAIGEEIDECLVNISRVQITEKVKTVKRLFGILMRSKMPATAAHEFAKKYQSVPGIILRLGFFSACEQIQIALKDLAERQGGPKAEIKEGQTSSRERVLNTFTQ